MNKKLFAMAVAAGMLAGCQTGGLKLSENNIDEIVAEMTLEEKAILVVGVGMDHEDTLNTTATVGSSAELVPGAAGSTHAIPRLGIPSVVLADGPAGLRINPTREGDENTYYCTHFPIGTLLASTWNQELVEEVGESIGEEVLEYGADVLLAPALNIHRNPLCGRNFEYYSEDPIVAGKTAAAYVRGVQKNDVGTSIKHFAVNSQETNRTGTDARLSTRALREIYLRNFEIAVKEGDPWTVMTSYNKVNGTYTSEYKDLVETLLRDEWGYKGMVMTDWYGGSNPTAQMQAGNDMLQPGRFKQYQDIIDAVNDGSLDVADLDRNVKRILQLIVRSPRFKGYKYSNKPELEEHAKVTRQSAVEGMVLLENNGVLPFQNTKNVAVYGVTSYRFIAGGTGSGNVNRAYTVSLLDGLKNAGYEIDKTVSENYETYVAKAEADAKAKLEAESKSNFLASFLPQPLPQEIIPTAEELKASVEANDAAIITLGRISGEFVDRTTANFNLSAEERQLVNDVTAAYHAAGKKVVVVLNVGGVIETASWKNTPDAILLAWQAGQEGGNSVADVLSGKENPSGKLPMTWPVALEDHGSTKNFPRGEQFELNLSAFMGKDAEKKEERNLFDYANYEEGIYVGYRWFDKNNVAVSYPFGYGLSYTAFDYSGALVEASDDAVTVTVKVTNSGKVAGKEVVQVYATAPKGTLDKPVKELKAYKKTKTLEPGESQVLVLKFATSDLASFSEADNAWVVDEGEYKFLVASSSRDIKAELTANVKGQKKEVKKIF
ncbi:MAG: beta-glucosidase [Prevotellaceae bacterium]|nr:beta-glucosidase [Prevotellaceae bacterium]